MSKRNRLTTGAQRTNLDDVAYGGGDLPDDFLFDLNNRDSSAVRQENEELRAEIEQLRGQIAEIEQSGTGLVLSQSGEIQIGRFTATSVGLIIPDDVTSDELAHIGDLLFRLEGSLQWLIGDWLISVDSWGDIPSIAEHFGRSPQTLRIWKMVAGKVELFRRRNDLSFTHHAEVVSLPEDEQDYWLDMAERGDVNPATNESLVWSASRLRREIAKSRQPEKAPRLPEEERFDKASKGIKRLFSIDPTTLSQKKREQHLGQIATLRRLLDEAERKLRDE